MKMTCDIYRSGKKPDTYLYVDPKVGLENLPAMLLQQFGKAHHAMTLELSADKKLARANSEQVLNCLREQGYYLQMPPQGEAYMQALRAHNDKLSERQ